MTQEEIRRRLRALLAMPPGTRPVTVHQLGKLAGMEKERLYEIARDTGGMRNETRIRLEKALTWVENDQVVWKVRTPHPPDITIREPQPPQKVVTVISFKDGRPRVRFLAQNPRTFPNFKDDALTS